MEAGQPAFGAPQTRPQDRLARLGGAGSYRSQGLLQHL